MSAIQAMLDAGAVWGTCPWCHADTPIYPSHCADGGCSSCTDSNTCCSGTTCQGCGRNIPGHLGDVAWRADYDDGCHVTYYWDGSYASGGPRHTPHDAFSKEPPVKTLVFRPGDTSSHAYPDRPAPRPPQAPDRQLSDRPWVGDLLGATLAGALTLVIIGLLWWLL